MILPPLPRAIIACRHGLEGEEQALDVDVEDLVEARPRHLDDGRHVEDRGVVDEDVDAAAAGHHPLHRRLDRVGRRHVEAKAVGAVADVGRGPLGRRGIEIGESHGRALLGIAAGDGAADAARPAGDERDLVLELHCRAAFPSLSKRWMRPGSGVRCTRAPFGDAECRPPHER